MLSNKLHFPLTKLHALVLCHRIGKQNINGQTQQNWDSKLCENYQYRRLLPNYANCNITNEDSSPQQVLVPMQIEYQGIFIMYNHQYNIFLFLLSFKQKQCTQSHTFYIFCIQHLLTLTSITISAQFQITQISDMIVNTYDLPNKSTKNNIQKPTSVYRLLKKNKLHNRLCHTQQAQQSTQKQVLNLNGKSTNSNMGHKNNNKRKIESFTTVLTKFTSQVKQAIKQEQKQQKQKKRKTLIGQSLNHSIFKQRQRATNKCSLKKLSLSIRKIRSFNTLQDDVMKRKENNYNSILNFLSMEEPHKKCMEDYRTLQLFTKGYQDLLSQCLQCGKIKNTQKRPRVLKKNTSGHQNFVQQKQIQVKVDIGLANKINEETISLQQKQLLQDSEVERKYFIPLGKIRKIQKSLLNCKCGIKHKNQLVQNLYRYKISEDLQAYKKNEQCLHKYTEHANENGQSKSKANIINMNYKHEQEQNLNIQYINVTRFVNNSIHSNVYTIKQVRTKDGNAYHGETSNQNARNKKKNKSISICVQNEYVKKKILEKQFRQAKNKSKSINIYKSKIQHKLKPNASNYQTFHHPLYTNMDMSINNILTSQPNVQGQGSNNPNQSNSKRSQANSHGECKGIEKALNVEQMQQYKIRSSKINQILNNHSNYQNNYHRVYGKIVGLSSSLDMKNMTSYPTHPVDVGINRSTIEYGQDSWNLQPWSKS